MGKELLIINTLSYRQHGEKRGIFMVILTQKNVEYYGETKFFEMNIMHDGLRIGYVELFVTFYEDGDEKSAYVKSIEIDETHRNCGYGTEVLKSLALEHEGIYIYPDNEGAKRLYERLGKEVDPAYIPDEIMSEYDESGIMYFID